MGALTRWPGHATPAENVQVQVINCLPSVLSGVHDNTITRRIDSFLPRRVSSDTEKKPEIDSGADVIE